MVEGYKPSGTVNLVGYTSTSKDKQTALNFAFTNYSDESTPVVFEIEFHGKKGLFEMTDDYTAYPGENEVLIQDGLKYQVITNQELNSTKYNKQFRFI